VKSNTAAMDFILKTKLHVFETVLPFQLFVLHLVVRVVDLQTNSKKEAWHFYTFVLVSE